eukprot:Hpha_TRINITY_DN15471_c4_g1::TRINITY_DN15471_c4_g1_i1::g.176704::m.176704
MEAPVKEVYEFFSARLMRRPYRTGNAEEGEESAVKCREEFKKRMQVAYDAHALGLPLLAPEWAQWCADFSTRWDEIASWVSPLHLRETMRNAMGCTWEKVEEVDPQLEEVPKRKKKEEREKETGGEMAARAQPQECVVCKTRCNSIEQYRTHAQGYKHKEKLAQLRIAEDPPPRPLNELPTAAGEAASSNAPRRQAQASLPQAAPVVPILASAVPVPMPVAPPTGSAADPLLAAFADPVPATRAPPQPQSPPGLNSGLGLGLPVRAVAPVPVPVPMPTPASALPAPAPVRQGKVAAAIPAPVPVSAGVGDFSAALFGKPQASAPVDMSALGLGKPPTPVRAPPPSVDMSALGLGLGLGQPKAVVAQPAAAAFAPAQPAAAVHPLAFDPVGPAFDPVGSMPRFSEGSTSPATLLSVPSSRPVDEHRRALASVPIEQVLSRPGGDMTLAIYKDAKRQVARTSSPRARKQKGAHANTIDPTSLLADEWATKMLRETLRQPGGHRRAHLAEKQDIPVWRFDPYNFEEVVVSAVPTPRSSVAGTAASEYDFSQM